MNTKKTKEIHSKIKEALINEEIDLGLSIVVKSEDGTTRGTFLTSPRRMIKKLIKKFYKSMNRKQKRNVLKTISTQNIVDLNKEITDVRTKIVEEINYRNERSLEERAKEQELSPKRGLQTSAEVDRTTST